QPGPQGWRALPQQRCVPYPISPRPCWYASTGAARSRRSSKPTACCASIRCAPAPTRLRTYSPGARASRWRSASPPAHGASCRPARRCSTTRWSSAIAASSRSSRSRPIMSCLRVSSRCGSGGGVRHSSTTSAPTSRFSLPRRGAFAVGRCTRRILAQGLLPYARRMAHALPLLHRLGDPPDDQAFDFIHIEPLVSRSSLHQWNIPAHRHRDLFQIFLIERGGGEMTYEASILPFEAPCALLIPPTTAHGFRFRANESDGWVVSF